MRFPDPVRRHVNPDDPDDMARFFAAWHWPGREMTKMDWRVIRLRMTRAWISRNVPQDHHLGWCVAVTNPDWRVLCRRFGAPGVFGTAAEHHQAGMES